MPNCCDPNYAIKFDKERAQTELSDYHDIGPRENSIPLVGILKRLDLEGKTLLDIGGGAGIIFYELWDKGISKVTHLDISQAYVDVFRKEVERMGLAGITESYCGDYLGLEPNIDPADLVVLDKVICCYQDFETLVKKSVKKANRFYAFSVPRYVWWIRMGHAAQQWWKRKKGDYFKTYIHPVPKMEAIIEAAGFEKIIHENEKEWTYLVFEKNKQ